MSESKPMGYMTDLRLLLTADCKDFGDHATHPPAYICHDAKEAVIARGIDVAAVERQMAQAMGRLRTLSDNDLLAMYLMDHDAQESGLSQLAYREVRRRESERGTRVVWVEAADRARAAEEEVGRAVAEYARRGDRR
jgi:hypothetical protein